MTKQQIFNKVARHLLKQNEQAMVGTMCQYRAPGGLKCAIGALIPDAKYKQEFEGSVVGILDEPESIAVRKAAGLKANQIALGKALQDVHDESDPANWIEQLMRVQKKFGLTWPRGLARK